MDGAGNQCREAVNKGLIMPFLHCFLLSVIGTQDGTEKIWYIMGWLRAVHWK